MRRYVEDQKWLFEEHLDALKEGYSRIAKQQTLELFT
jgi:hypothetical protein